MFELFRNAVLYTHSRYKHTAAVPTVAVAVGKKTHHLPYAFCKAVLSSSGISSTRLCIEWRSFCCIYFHRIYARVIEAMQLYYSETCSMREPNYAKEKLSKVSYNARKHDELDAGTYRFLTTEMHLRYSEHPRIGRKKFHCRQ